MGVILRLFHNDTSHTELPPEKKAKRSDLLLSYSGIFCSREITVEHAVQE